MIPAGLLLLLLPIKPNSVGGRERRSGAWRGRSLHGFVPVTPEAEAPRCAKGCLAVLQPPCQSSLPPHPLESLDTLLGRSLFHSLVAVPLVGSLNRRKILGSQRLYLTAPCYPRGNGSCP
ncbi:unnamed protein product [Pleuronectes platessa]|uniref:Secreted protein n=1 Tax=Pleuronectes platessa TaxID=8262 RepID=A0A9N7UPK0_PLEPL|nr:unnamed protein product [Pleuronectes platessa]